MSYDPKNKILFVGNLAAGKTALLHRITTGEYHEHLPASVAVSCVPATSYDLILFDSQNGNSNPNFITPWLKTVGTVAITIDCTNEQSIKIFNTWIKLIEQYKTYKLHLVLIITKTDDAAKRKHSLPLLLQAALNNNIAMVIETSAKTGTNVKQVYEGLQFILKPDTLDSTQLYVYTAAKPEQLQTAPRSELQRRLQKSFYGYEEILTNYITSMRAPQATFVPSSPAPAKSTTEMNTVYSRVMQWWQSPSSKRWYSHNRKIRIPKQCDLCSSEQCYLQKIPGCTTEHYACTDCISKKGLTNCPACTQSQFAAL